MICQFVGGPIDGERHEMGDEPPQWWNVARPVTASFLLDAVPDPVCETSYSTYSLRAFADRYSGRRLYAYFCGVETASVVPIALCGQLYLTRPRDVRNVGANVLAKMFQAQLAWWDLRALRDQLDDEGKGDA